MRTQTSHHLAFLFGLLWVLCAVAPATAEDTEIYVGLSASQTAARPNVLFIMDTSGSMGSEVRTDSDPYDPSVTYTVPDGSPACDPNNLYWTQTHSRGNNTPSCDTNQWFPKANFNCGNDQAVNNLNLKGTADSSSTGFETDKFARWAQRRSGRRNRSTTYEWTDLSSRDQNPQYVECSADWGIHGETDTSSDKYLANGDYGPWTSNPVLTGRRARRYEFNWSNATAYTVYSANYLNWYWYHNNDCTITNTCPTRLEVVQQVLTDLINSTSGLNIGLMRFETNSGYQGNYGGAVIFPMTYMDQSSTTVTDFNNAVNSLTDSGNTPLAETMYEAMQYYRGGSVHFGSSSANIPSVSGSLDPDDSTKYKSPIEYQCQKNFVVYLTDGEPTLDGDADTLINNTLASGPTLTTGKTCSFSGHDPYDDCLDNLAEYMYKTDNATSNLGNDLDGTQNITTYTIGFDLSGSSGQRAIDLLTSTAQNSGGKFYTVENTQTLNNAFHSITREILAVNSTFTAPAVSVNAFNRITHRKELYFTIFRPDQFVHWPGNVKRFDLDYQLNAQGNPIDSNNDGIPDPPIILDANGNPAVDSKTGFFKSDSTSFWTPSSQAPDGDNTTLGGAASQIPEDPNTRHIYTYTGGTDKVLSHTENLLNESNAQTTSNPSGVLTKAMFNVTSMSDTDFTTLIKWARGVDVNDQDEDGSTADGRKVMGDPLHAKPVLITYGGSETNPDITMYAITNDGYLHAINVSDGSELFTFVPQDQLANLDTLYNNDVSDTNYSHNYGLDGNIEVWIKDDNGNGIIETTGGNDDHVYIYFGQRRGGTHYYALDVTDRNNPKLLWTIEGGAGDFALLSDTWSKPIHQVIKVLSSDSSKLESRDVLVFGGGYDTTNDTPDQVPPLTDSVGTAIYIVDATTGERLWWAGPTDLTPAPNFASSDMTHSIPSQVKVLDVNGDGYADRMYVGDLGGQIWRFDIDNTTLAALSSRITGGVIAKLQYANASATPEDTDNRQFFYAPDVALINQNDGSQFLSIAIGSGYRPHPLNTTVHDRFYMIRDYHVYDVPTTYSAITEDDLFDATNVINFTGAQITEFNAKHGWYINMNNVVDNSWEGEKVLATALTFQGYILFTTFAPVENASADACSPSQGVARTYLVNVTDATPVRNLDGLGTDTALTRADRALTLVRTGLPPEVTIVFPPGEGAQPVALVGAEQLDLGLVNNPVKTYWFQDHVN